MKTKPLTENERTHDVYEQLPGYTKPPLVPLPEPGDYETLTEFGIKLTPFSRKWIKNALALTGFNAFQKQLPDKIEGILRTFNSRTPGLFSPVISATLALKDDTRILSPAERAATLVFGARSLYDDLRSGNFAPDRFRDQVLEMGQYPNLFSTHLIIENKHVRMFKSKNVNQITIAAGRRLSILEIGDLSTATSLAQLIEALEQVLRHAKENPLRDDEAGMGVLTCATNATQFRIFRKISAHPTNRESLQALRNSFLNLCFDFDSNPSSDAEAAFWAQSTNPSNRWFHTSLQFVIFGNAKACALCNFTTYLDGNTMMRGAAEMQKRAAACQLPSDSERETAPALAPAVPLKWSQVNKLMALQAQRDLKPILDNQQVTFEIPGFGKTFFKRHNLDAVPTFILALELAAMRFVGKTARITQFLTMSRYRSMDLVTAMVTTPEVEKFVSYMGTKDRNKAEALKLMQAAIESQAQECRRLRRYLLLPDILMLFVRSQKGIAKLWSLFVLSVSIMIFRRLGLYKPLPREILVSHPEIYPEIPIVGRPGVRLPYVKYFGLHYQIMDDRIVITMMPAVTWMVPNTELMAELKASLEKIRALLE